MKPRDIAAAKYCNAYAATYKPAAPAVEPRYESITNVIVLDFVIEDRGDAITSWIGR